MRWFKLTNGNLVNLGRATDIVVGNMISEPVEGTDKTREYCKVRIVFGPDDFTPLPEEFPSKEAAREYIAALFDAFNSLND